MTPIEYREPAGIEELEAVFRLRFDVYANDEQLHALVPHAFGSDLGTYDVNGLHFAAFEGQQPVAYLRMTTDAPTHFAPLVQQLMKTAGTACQTDIKTFPFLGYYPDKAWSEAFLRSLQGRKIGEVGRLVVHTGYRQGRVLSELIAAFIAYCRDD